jgi:16S rRNA (cytidine1402-2'-O)-methyltransferase
VKPQRPPAQVVVVSTPIGNLGDLSPRAVAALARAGYIYCEDTRRALTLLTHSGVTGPRLVPHHAHNEAASTASALRRLEEGAIIAVVTDAGTPLVSDPGARLVREALAAGFTVEAVPGPSAVLAALVISGLATDRWCFEGFLPRSGRQRTERIAAVAAEERTTVLFESPHRLQRSLDDLVAACGPDRPLAVCRELTKMYEEVWRGTTGELAERARAVKPRGEYVLVLGQAAKAPRDKPVSARRSKYAALGQAATDVAGPGPTGA